jgi:biotin transporter BioY
VQTGFRNRFRISVLIYSMTNAVIFGAGLIIVLNVSELRANAHIWILIVVVASLILAAPIAWLIAPRLQARYDRRHTT